MHVGNEVLNAGTIVIAKYLDETAVIGEVVGHSSHGFDFKTNNFPIYAYSIKLKEPIKGNKWITSKKKGERIQVNAEDIRYFYQPDEVMY